MRSAVLISALIMASLALNATATAAPPARAAITDPPRDARNPTANKQLLIPSHGFGMNALLFKASGKGPHPTVILMHGLPGNERNLDLAQAIRRAGWDVLTFTYRGAWGSAGDFSIANAMEDAQAALDFARSPEAAKLGINTRRIVLAGHSMGGATAMMTAADARGLDGLILIDAWNIAYGTSKGATTRDELISGFDDFGNSLHGATPESVADEVLAKRPQWDLVTAAKRLPHLPILTVTAKYGGAAENLPTTAALRSAGNRHVTAVEMDTDHPFSDHRIALSSTVIRWLQSLRR
jgi:pimeloyl-ACP methyl ester carboxylesterase